MKFIILFEDNDEKADLRQAHMPAHLDFLQKNQDRIRAAGPLFEPSGSGAGGLWLVDADDTGVIEDLVTADPFWPTGLRRFVKVLEWRQVFAEGRQIFAS